MVQVPVFSRPVSAFAIVLAIFTTSSYGQKCATISPAQGAPVTVPGVQTRVVINGLKSPRGMVFDTAGNLLVVEQGGGGIRYIKLTDNGGIDVCLTSSKTLIADNTLNHGIDLSADGKTLFASSLLNVYSYPYNAATGTVGTRRTLVQNMQNGGHSTRTLWVSRFDPDTLLVSRGSDGNLDLPTAEMTSGRSQLRAFSISATSKAAVNYTAGEVIAWGLRNSVGVSEDLSTGGLWSVENSVDDMKRQGVDVHQTNPGEELNYHGLVNKTAASPQRGLNYGYPSCFAAWDPSVLPNNANIKVGTQFLIGDPSDSNTDALCLQRQGPRLTFPSHTAPLDVKFNRNGTAAYIAFHGSWNRQPADGYRLSRIAFKNGQPIEPVTSTTAAFNILYNPNNANCPSRCFRPTTLAFDAKDRLFMTSDSTGEIYVIIGA
ncbi:related to L-sorbosone dehydrogenase [Rhynchosporium secalis]|uniref:Related to L-sorbosone dehydrogenase n=1 Tax=Rhynchosporium secalis TaxID=38038 RepID=A0A1E1MM46_RHYSE|nr:related to L-sorbosone dehydrogenase [Rhynchosporium secalis]